MDIAGWSIWITGAGTGIGAAMARAFSAAGCTVALTGRRPEPLEALAAELGSHAFVIPGDVTDRERMVTTATEIERRTGRLDVLCNNAGLNVKTRTWDNVDWDAWDRVIDVNVKGAMAAIVAALPIMRAAGGGVIINTSSWAGRFHSVNGGVPYGATKHAVTDLSANLNASEGKNGIRACALCPAEVATPLLAGRPGWDTADNAHIIQPEDMAEAALLVARMNPNVAIHEITLAPVRR
ncbi:MAG: SDR family NAD(P)-dependent oxidoreductase [Pseudomonadota bacterium]